MTDSEAIDDAVFEAAVAGFLQEFNLERLTPVEGLHILEPLSPDSPVTQRKDPNTTERAKLKANERRDRYRKKLQAERETLRRQERELTAKLSRLQETQAKAQEEGSKTNMLALGAWKATAARQKEKRVEAEKKQQQLKAAVHCRAEMIRHLNAVLMQPTPLKSLTSGEDQVLSSKDVQGALLFKTFIGELDAVYARTDEFVHAKLNMSSPEAFGLRRKWNRDKTLLESGDATQISVAFDRAWRLISTIVLADPSGCHYTGEIDDPENTAAITYRVNYRLESGDTTTLVIYDTVRRYIEKDRVVFVWRLLSEGQDEFEGLYSDEHAWLVIRPSDSTDGRATTLESYTQRKPMDLDGQSASSNSRGTRFVKLLRKADEDDMSEMKQAMLRLLVDEDSDVKLELKLLSIGDNNN